MTSTIKIDPNFDFTHCPELDLSIGAILWHGNISRPVTLHVPCRQAQAFSCSHNDRIWPIGIYFDVAWIVHHMNFRIIPCSIIALKQNELANKGHRRGKFQCSLACDDRLSHQLLPDRRQIQRCPQNQNETSS